MKKSMDTKCRTSVENARLLCERKEQKGAVSGEAEKGYFFVWVRRGMAILSAEEGLI